MTHSSSPRENGRPQQQNVPRDCPRVKGVEAGMEVTDRSKRVALTRNKRLSMFGNLRGFPVMEAEIAWLIDNLIRVRLDGAYSFKSYSDIGNIYLCIQLTAQQIKHILI